MSNRNAVDVAQERFVAEHSSAENQVFSESFSLFVIFRQDLLLREREIERGKRNIPVGQNV
jgi:hypothetical protein